MTEDAWVRKTEQCKDCAALYEERGCVPEAAICDAHYAELKSFASPETLAWWDNQIAGGKRIQVEIDEFRADLRKGES